MPIGNLPEDTWVECELSIIKSMRTSCFIHFGDMNYELNKMIDKGLHIEYFLHNLYRKNILNKEGIMPI